MYTLVYKFDNDEVERSLSCKCTVLCYIFEYIYTQQKKKNKIKETHLYYIEHILCISEKFIIGI